MCIELLSFYDVICTEITCDDKNKNSCTFKYYHRGNKKKDDYKTETIILKSDLTYIDLCTDGIFINKISINGKVALNIIEWGYRKFIDWNYDYDVSEAKKILKYYYKYCTKDICLNYKKSFLK